MVKKQTKQQLIDAVSTEQIETVFQHWVTVIKSGNKLCRLDQARAYVIARAILDYGVDTCVLAVSGCARSPFHMGENSRKKTYNDLTLIFRDADHVEKFVALAEQPTAKEAFLAEG